MTLNLGKLTLKKEFYETYGRHIFLIEVALVSTLTFTFFVQMFLPSFIFPFSILSWFIAYFVGIGFHVHIFYKIADTELCPYEIIRLERFRSYFFNILLLLVFFFLLLLYLLSGLLPRDSFLSLLVSITIIIAVMGYFFVIFFPMFLCAFFLRLASISNYRRARLSFKTVLEVMNMMNAQRKTSEKAKLIRKYVKCFEDGLRSYNSHLRKNTPISLEIINIGDYYRSISSVALMGKRRELETIVDQLRLALNYMRANDFRRFLITLKNIKEGKTRRKYSLSELNEMIRVLSLSERVKEGLKSPHVAFLIGIVAIVLQVLRFVWELSLF